MRRVPSASELAVYSGASLPQAREAVAHRHMALGAQVVDLNCFAEALRLRAAPAG